MPGNTFGYEPTTLPSYIARYDDYVGGESIDYQPTPWDDFGQVNIETMWSWVQYESDEKTRAVAEMWRRVGVLLEATRDNLERYATSLQRSWQSPAAQEFLRRVGAAIYSLDEWQQAAVANDGALTTAADKISTTQDAMRDIWYRFTVAAADAERRREEERTDGVLMSIARGFTEDPPTHDEVRRQFTDEATPVMRSLADTYTDSALNLERGTTFKGPTTSADVRDSGTSIGPDGPGGGSGSWASPTAPDLPFPEADTGGGPQHAGVLPLAPSPPMPAGPVAPIAPAPPTAPVPPGFGPVAPLPAYPSPPGAAPRPGTPAVPGRPLVDPRMQPGQSPGSRVPPASRPNLPGMSSRPGTPSGANTPGPGTPRRPDLRGSSPKSASTVPPRPAMPRADLPARPGAAAPKLDGRHASRPVAPAGGKAGGSAGGKAGGSAGNPTSNLAGRRQPGTASAPVPRAGGKRGRAGNQHVLGGRTAAKAPAVPGTPRGTQLGRPKVDGRGTGPERVAGQASTGRKRGAAHDERAPRTGSDQGPWAVDGATSAVDAPAPARAPAPAPSRVPKPASGVDPGPAA